MGRIPATSISSRLGAGISGNEFFTSFANNRYRADGTVPGLIYCPAVGAGGYNMFGFNPAKELARRGYPVLSGDLGCTPTRVGLTDGPHKWGNDASLAILDNYRTYLQGTLGAKAGKIGLLYGSGGAPAAYAWAAAHPTDVICIAGAIGTVDVEDIRANNRNGYQASVETAYTDNAGWQAARLTHNPVEVAATLAVPQLDYYGTTDTICLPATHEALATAAGANMTQVAMEGVGHTTSPLSSNPLLDDFCDWVEIQLAA